MTIRARHHNPQTLGRRLLLCGALVAVGVFTYPSHSTAESDCPALKESVNKSASPLVMISEAPIPGPKTLRQAPSAAQMKCMEQLLDAGKRAIEKKRLVEGITRYLAAVQVAPSQAEVAYQELAIGLDRNGYSQPARAAYNKAWQVFETDYSRPDAKLDGVAVLALAEIRDSIVRLGGQVPAPTSEVGRTVVANSTRHLREQYFNTDPLLAPDTSVPEKP